VNKKCVFLLLAVMVCLVIISFYSYRHFTKSGVQSVISTVYMNEKEMIKSFGREQEVQYLSESIGQYMEYLLLIKDKYEFKRQVEVLSENFLVEKDNQLFIKWQDSLETTTNASVDDLRIIEALYEGGDRFNNSAYIELADKLKHTLEIRQSVDGILVDFYDWELGDSTTNVHLSYINYNGLQRFDSINIEHYQKIIEGAMGSPYFYEIYDMENQDYQSADEKTVNMIDQLLIAIQYQEITGKVPTLFDKWVKRELDSNNKLYGIYQKESLGPAVNYESSAVYALGVIYFKKIGDPNYADKLHKLLMGQPPFHENPDYKNIHFFDYIYAKTADALYTK
jgi:hypothetical protein